MYMCTSNASPAYYRELSQLKCQTPNACTLCEHPSPFGRKYRGWGGHGCPRQQILLTCVEYSTISKQGISLSYPSVSSPPSLVTKYITMQIFWAISSLSLAIHSTINCPDSFCLAQCLITQYIIYLWDLSWKSSSLPGSCRSVACSMKDSKTF